MNEETNNPGPPPIPEIPSSARAAGSVLGRRGAGVPKNYSPEDREKRRAAMGVINERRRTMVMGKKRLKVVAVKRSIVVPSPRTVK